MIRRPTQAIIDLQNLEHNFKSIKGFIGGAAAFLAVVKADAYGHGMAECARKLQSAGADWFGVALLEEALELRASGIERPILCFGGVWPGQEEDFIRHGVTPAIIGPETASRLSAAASAHGTQLKVFVKIDTGMGRVGVTVPEVPSLIKELLQSPRLEVEGLITHFAAADDPAASGFTHSQIESFSRVVALFREAGFDPQYLSIANSPGAVIYPEALCNMVRVGGLMYGRSEDILPAGSARPAVRPVMSLTTRIARVKRLPAGTPLGYGRTFVTDRESTIGTIPIGYHDGYSRRLSNVGRVLVNGRPAPVVGRISMDWTIIDLTDAGRCEAGDEVAVIGRQGELEITVEEIAGMLGTISYEITCGIGDRVPRVYRDAASPDTGV